MGVKHAAESSSQELHRTSEPAKSSILHGTESKEPRAGDAGVSSCCPKSTPKISLESVTGFSGKSLKIAKALVQPSMSKPPAAIGNDAVHSNRRLSLM